MCTVPLLNHIFQLDSFLLVSSLESPVKNLKKLLVDLIKVFNQWIHLKGSSESKNNNSSRTYSTFTLKCFHVHYLI